MRPIKINVNTNTLKVLVIKNNSRVLKVFVALCVILLAITLLNKLSIEDFTSFLTLLMGDKNRASAYITFFLASTFASIMFVPVSWIKVTGGLLLDFWPGFLLSWLAVNVGGLVIFIVCRFWGKRVFTNLLKKKVKSDGNVDSMLNNIDNSGLPLIMNLQMLPILPCSLVNVMCGLSAVSYKTYVIASLLGTLPGTIISVNLSSKVVSETRGLEALIFPIILFISFNLATYYYGKKSKARFLLNTNK